MKSVFQGTDPVDTLIFDEIDTGISGQTALRVARALKNLAAEKQIVCITHLPQIAALADHHIHVEKETTGSSTHVHVGYVRNEERKRVLNTLLTVTEIEDQ
ncbi:MAG: hypothetical protein D6762_06880 [Candidatus Neomarinimicrobiota bacterium]|nr:MAG: hypothetical protein D6762_06880 [Candidatus Neomarinimicrobiota bacterium]